MASWKNTLNAGPVVTILSTMLAIHHLIVSLEKVLVLIDSTRVFHYPSRKVYPLLRLRHHFRSTQSNFLIFLSQIDCLSFLRKSTRVPIYGRQHAAVVLRQRLQWVTSLCHKQSGETHVFLQLLLNNRDWKTRYMEFVTTPKYTLVSNCATMFTFYRPASVIIATLTLIISAYGCWRFIAHRLTDD